MNVSTLFFKNNFLKELEIKKTVDGYQVLSFFESQIEEKGSKKLSLFSGDSKALIACIDQKEFLFRSFCAPPSNFLKSNPQSLIELEDTLSSSLEEYAYTFSKKRIKRGLSKEYFSLCKKKKLDEITSELKNFGFDPNFCISEASANIKYITHKEKKGYPLIIHVYANYTSIYFVEEFLINKAFEIEMCEDDFCSSGFERNLDRILFLVSKETNFSQMLALCVVKEEKIKASLSKVLINYGLSPVFRSYDDQDLAPLIGSAIDFFEDDKNSNYFEIKGGLSLKVKNLLQSKMIKFFSTSFACFLFLFSFFHVFSFFNEKKLLTSVEKLEIDANHLNHNIKTIEDRLSNLSKTLVKTTKKKSNTECGFSLSSFLIFIENTLSSAQLEYEIEKLQVDPISNQSELDQKMDKFNVSLFIKIKNLSNPEKFIEEIKKVSYIEDLKVEERGGVYEVFFATKA